MEKYRYLAIAIGVSLLAGCGGAINGNSQIPSVNQANLSTIGALQFAVGTAHLADGTIGLNTVATFRQSDGRSVTLVNTPSIAGPAGFTVPNFVPTKSCGTSTYLKYYCQPNPGPDVGTNSITGQPQNPNPLGTPKPSTFDVRGGVFAAGFAPYNATQNVTLFYPSMNSPSYALPFYSTSPQYYIGGPPAYPYINNGLYPNGYFGWLTGFSAFEAAPVAGSYALNVAIAAGNAAGASYSAQASLNDMNPLPALSAPAFAPDGAGGGTVTLTVPADGRIVETLAYVLDTNYDASITQQGPTFYAIGPVKGTGTLTFTLPSKLGPCGGSKGQGCETDPTKQQPSLVKGDTYKIYLATFDYPQFEAEPPGNMTQKPTITGSNGQADVTLSPVFSGTY